MMLAHSTVVNTSRGRNRRSRILQRVDTFAESVMLRRIDSCAVVVDVGANGAAQE